MDMEIEGKRAKFSFVACFLEWRQRADEQTCVYPALRSPHSLAQSIVLSFACAFSDEMFRLLLVHGRLGRDVEMNEEADDCGAAVRAMHELRPGVKFAAAHGRLAAPKKPGAGV